MNNLPLTPRQIAILLIGLIVVGGGGYLIYGNLNSTKTPPPVTITAWGPLPYDAAMKQLVASQLAVSPGVTFKYEEIPASVYEERLVNALAAGTGPDVFMIRNRWLPKHKDKLSPAPTTVMRLTEVDTLYPYVVRQDFVAPTDKEAKIYGIFALPLYLDTLALYYNRDLFDQAALVAPPKDWKEFSTYTSRVRSLNSSGQLVRAGAAIGGTAKTIPYVADLASVLMMQYGAPMADATSRAVSFGGASQGGLAGFQYYLQFANPGSPLYAWNENQRVALDAFTEGSVGMMFGYAETSDAIRKKNAFLRYSVAPLPQVDASKAVSYADYWGFAVSRQSKVKTQAWTFIKGLVTNEAAAQSFTTASGRPPALRSIIGKATNDSRFGTFARQALTARSWYQVDDGEISQLFSDAVGKVLAGQIDASRALKEVEGQINALMNRAQRVTQ